MRDIRSNIALRLGEFPRARPEENPKGGGLCALGIFCSIVKILKSIQRSAHKECAVNNVQRTMCLCSGATFGVKKVRPKLFFSPKHPCFFIGFTRQLLLLFLKTNIANKLLKRPIGDLLNKWYNNLG